MGLPRKCTAGSMTALILAVAAIAVIVLVWMGVRLMRQDRALEAQRIGERREAAADRAVAVLEQAIAAEGRRLAAVAVLVMVLSFLIARAVSREPAAAQLQLDFVSAVSHEFRTPLTSMRQFTEMLAEDDGLPPEKRRVFCRAQERATRRLSRLVESLLDFGRMEAGARPYRLEPLDAGQLVGTVVDEFREEGARGGFTVECVFTEERFLVNGDREALAQALWNLLDNAVKYSGDSRTIRVELAGGDKVSIGVRDEGYGILPSERNQILRKFTRGSCARAHGVKGTGIGLEMVKHSEQDLEIEPRNRQERGASDRLESKPDGDGMVP